MSASTGFPRDAQPSDTQVSVSGFEGPPGAPSNPDIPVNLAVASAQPEGPGGLPGISGEEFGAAVSAAPSGYPIPPASFTYNVHLSFTSSAGSLEQSASSSVSKSSTTATPLTPQIHVPDQSPSVGASSYNFSHSGNKQPDKPSMNNLATQETGVVSSTSSLMNSPYFALRNAWMPIPPSFPMPSGVSGMTGTLGPPGILPSTANSSNQTVPSGTMEPSSSAVPRPSFPVTSDSAASQHTYSLNLSLPPLAAVPQGPWVQPPQMGVLPRPPFLPYPGPLPSQFSVPGRGLPIPSVSVPGSRPPSVTPLGNTGTVPIPSAPVREQVHTPGMQTDISPPGIDNSKNVIASSVKNASGVNEESDAWTPHRTNTGIIYYYNAITGESTYEKPPGFKGEPDKVPVQATPISMENLEGTDWALVATSDGRKYYYNSKTKVSSWQIPSEVTKLRKKQEAEGSKELSKSVPDAVAANEKGSVAASTTASGGHDVTSPRAPSLTGSTPALDLIKRKLQEPGTPITSSPVAVSSGAAAPETNGSKSVEATVKVHQNENDREKKKAPSGDENLSDTSESEDDDSRPTKEECVAQFKEMLKERGVAPFSKWEKELPKIVFDPRFKAIPSYSARRALFERFVKTRAEEERKEKRAAQKAAIEGFKRLLEEAIEDIDHNTDYQTFKKRWGNDPRFLALDRKEKEAILNERVLPLKKAAGEKARAEREAAVSDFKAMLQERGDIISINSRWSKVKDSLRNDPRYKSVKHEDREILFDEYISDLKAAADKVEREEKAKRDEQEKLREREREFRKRKEREELEMERVKMKVRRKEAAASFQTLLVETIKDPQASWTESKVKLEKDPQRRASNPDLDPSDMEKLFRDQVKMLHERCLHEFKTLLAEVITLEAAEKETDGKTVLNSWSTAKRLLKPDPRYNRCPRKDREVLWRRYADDVLRRHNSALGQKEDKHLDFRGRNTLDSGRHSSGSRRTEERR